jgi:alanyl-tRNA synthetase
LTGTIIKIKKVQCYGPYVLHIGEVESGTCSVGDVVSCSVDYVRRLPIASNHIMTHVLNYALNDALVTQPGKASGQKDPLRLIRKVH